MARFEQFWDVTCEYRDYIFIGVMLFIFLFVLAVISLLFAPRETPSYVLAVINFVMISVVGSVVAWMFWVCVRRESEPY